MIFGNYSKEDWTSKKKIIQGNCELLWIRNLQTAYQLSRNATLVSFYFDNPDPLILNDGAQFNSYLSLCNNISIFTPLTKELK